MVTSLHCTLIFTVHFVGNVNGRKREALDKDRRNYFVTDSFYITKFKQNWYDVNANTEVLLSVFLQNPCKV